MSSSTLNLPQIRKLILLLKMTTRALHVQFCLVLFWQLQDLPTTVNLFCSQASVDSSINLQKITRSNKIILINLYTLYFFVLYFLHLSVCLRMLFQNAFGTSWSVWNQTNKFVAF